MVKRSGFLAALVAAALAAGVFSLGVAREGRAIGVACEFQTSANTMELLHDCDWSATIVAPNGFTLEGRRHTIFAFDPRTAVVRATGGAETVQNLKIVMTVIFDSQCDSGPSQAPSQCCSVAPTPAGDAEADAVGILFEGGAHGFILKNEIVIINQFSGYGCCGAPGTDGRRQGCEGPSTPLGNGGGSSGIILTNDGNPSVAPTIIGANRVSGYSRAGIWADGRGANAVIASNFLKGDPNAIMPYEVQAGVYLTDGAPSAVAANIIIETALTDGIGESNPIPTFATAGVYTDDASAPQIKGNIILGSSTHGVILEDSSNGNVGGNIILGAEVGVLIFGSEGDRADNNVVQGNLIAPAPGQATIQNGGFYAGVFILDAANTNNNKVIGNSISGCYDEPIDNEGTNTTVFANAILPCVPFNLPG